MDAVGEVRSFNRFYTRQVGLLAEHLPESDLSLTEGRVVYELASGGEQTAAVIARTLGVDKAHLSRIVGRLRARGLIRSRVSKEHGKQRPLSLSARGRKAFAALDRGTRAHMETILAPLDDAARRRLIASMQRIKSELGAGRPDAGSVLLRSPRPGDLGFITHRQATLYHEEYGWDWTYEGLAATILGNFVAGFDPKREDAWVAERAGGIVGSIFLMRSDDPQIAKLRLLHVEPAVRGLGLGKRLVVTCIERARELGYRHLTLWTNDVLVAARRIYEAQGFRLTNEARHHSFGHDLVGQTWMLDLQGR